MKKRGWIVLFLAFPLWMQGQSAREEIGKNPALAAGKYYAYQAPEEKLTPAPAGYEPFYISMFARHGSRYLTKEKKYAAPLSLLLEADEEGVLTPDGKCVLKVVASLAQEAEGRYGELTPKGAQQHRELIDGCSTVTRRCSVTVRMWMHAPHTRPVLFFPWLPDVWN